MNRFFENWKNKNAISYWICIIIVTYIVIYCTLNFLTYFGYGVVYVFNQFNKTRQEQVKEEPNVNIAEPKEEITFDNSPELQAKYKAEIETLINNECAKCKKEIDVDYNNAIDLYSTIFNESDFSTENYTKFESYTRALETPVFWLYVKLIDTTKKYTDIGQTPATDFYPTLAEFIVPILKKYNISNLDKITELVNYMDVRYADIEEKCTTLRKIMYPEDVNNSQYTE